jgi:LysM repeat protein
MEITHEQARRLIQMKLDRALHKQEASTLSTHLRDCTDCQSYANQMDEVEGLLVPLMKQQWAVQPTPLSISALTRGSRETQARIVLTIRTAVVSFIFVAVFFGMWQFLLSRPSMSNQMPPAVPAMPTPASYTAQVTSTTNTRETCELTMYKVQDHDTLAGIAKRFSVAEAEILAVNNLGTDALRPTMELVIPVCNFTPTGTIYPATLTTTYTPILQPTTSTPGG